MYLIVLSVQVCKARGRRGRYEYTDSSEYTDLSAADSELHRARLEFISVPNTCSYADSQLHTPDQSVYSGDYHHGGSNAGSAALPFFGAVASQSQV